MSPPRPLHQRGATLEVVGDSRPLATSAVRLAVAATLAVGAAAWPVNALGDPATSDPVLGRAISEHRRAQEQRAICRERRQQAACEEAKLAYRKAAELYRLHLVNAPPTPATYEAMFYRAETLYWAERWDEAALAYQAVLNSRVGTRYREDAAFSLVKARENRLEELRQVGQWTEFPLPSPKVMRGRQTPVPIHPAEQRLIEAADAFVRLLPTSPQAPRMVYQAAEIYHRHLDFAASRARFDRVVRMGSRQSDKLCTDAVRSIIDTYIIEQDLVGVDAAVRHYAKAWSGCFARGPRRPFPSLPRADRLFVEGRYEEAVRTYLELIDLAPRAPDADKALNNAAVAMEKLDRFAAAARIYERLVREYPASRFVDHALFRQALNAQYHFDFAASIALYLRLVDEPRFTKSEHRLYALYNAALLLEADHQHARAASLFARYARLTPKADDAAEARHRAEANRQRLRAPRPGPPPPGPQPVIFENPRGP
jgi:tetratricopeptide (TPR) repeat protein